MGDECCIAAENFDLNYVADLGVCTCIRDLEYVVLSRHRQGLNLVHKIGLIEIPDACATFTFKFTSFSSQS